MSSTTMLVIFMLALFLAFSITANAVHYSRCSGSFFQLITQKKNLTNCKKLTTLGAEFGWSINKNNDHQIEIIFAARLYADYGWLAWGVNPEKMPQMVGTRAVVGIRHENGSSIIETYNITSDTKLGCKLTPTSFNVEAQNEVIFRNIAMEYLDDLDYYSIQASVVLPSAAYDVSKLNHVWQVGYDLAGTNPKNHPRALQNVDSTETLNLMTGRPARHVGKHRQYLRTVHGILNIVGWGAVLPAGVMIARYFKYPLDMNKWWFCLHVSCQIIGYILGTTGWIIGLCLGSASKFYIFRTHRLYSMFIFAFTTLQMFALRLKPERTDEYRKYWNMYHHFTGYALLAVISINIFQGIDILKPDKTWKWVYTAILIAIAAIVAALEIYTWTKFKRNTRKTTAVQQEGPTSSSTDLAPPPPLP
ncbi:cytochrome b561 and DOMON domain-containing protein At4g12980 [Ricinus communis]|uniref:Cytochrome b561 and DOMON domain-containing protein n=1 Tax=Ricinus communis TaxID=3988 RepID=B9STY5_RICCO|nr:cytochrome b561 and DOMON domain-containing protein At4g12980 [Ricinus communis]EEF32920.1 dopamine beta-monooxygenase, putative [Ricinus communis]|eukprot:XP_002529454.1 cytochrome b561 and DOMON domain-containing protein At4g12980 [Ricinus communis]